MSDQVTHTPWEIDDSPEWTPWSGAVVIFSGGDDLLWTDSWEDDPGRARRVAEQVTSAVNSHDALTARVAELEAENERLRELIECAALYLDAFEGDIMEIDPEVLTGIPLSPTNMAAGVRAAALNPEA